MPLSIKLQCSIELIAEILRAAAVIGKGRDCRKRVLIAHKAAEAGFHAPDGDQRARRNAVALSMLVKKRRILCFLRACPAK